MYDQLVRSERKTERVFSALSDALPGTVLDDTYRLDAKIGEGGFGAVFRATHLGLDRPVAVKVLRPTSASDAPGALARFKLEGIAACRVVHPNAVEVLDSGVAAGGMPYLVMELLRGYTLAWTLKVKGALSLAVAAPILRDVCGVLAEAHDKGIVHRDIKPDNVFLHQTQRGEVVKVVDFGIAKLTDDEALPELEGVTVAGVIVGTPDYAANERVLGEAYDGKADVFSVAVMAYLMLGGALPFGAHHARSAAAAAVQRLTARPKPLGELASDIPEAVERVVMRSLSNDPNDRATAREFGEAFATVTNRG
jgi:serine/threonine protein kinase